LFRLRATYVADLESRLLPFRTKLIREEKTAHLDPYFADSADSEDDWRTTYLRFKDSESALACVERVTQLMHKSIIGTLEEKETKIIGWLILNTTTWKWKDVDGKSRKRDWEALAKIAIIEHTRIIRIRKRLVCTTPVAHFRKKLADILSEAAIPTTQGGQQLYKWEFPDRFAPSDLSDIPDIEPMTIEQRLVAVTAQGHVDTYRTQITKIVRTVQNLGVATIDGSVRGHLEENVYDALRTLVEACLFLYIN
jgi:hypothetical protein